MKKQKALLALFALLVITTVWWFLIPRSKPVAAKTQESNSTTDQNPRKTDEPSPDKSPERSTEETLDKIFTKTSDPAYARYYYEQTKIDSQFDWKQPINFYGRVMDESNAVVVGASIHFTWNDISEKGTSEADATSDNNGFFSLTDRRGKRLYVDVGKNGYYSSGNSRGAAFEYANPYDGLFRPDAGNPVVFHLRKIGVGADLITSQYGVKPYFGITVPLDGTPIQADLIERKTGQGQITISQIKPKYKSWKQATNWIFRMEIPDGGFVGENDEFAFTAPEEGYQSAVEFSFQKSQPDWVENLKTNYYIKFGKPPRYGWLKLDTSILMEGARLTYAINPDGSRNLEPKQ